MLYIIKKYLRPIRDYLRSLNPIRFSAYDKYYFPPIPDKIPISNNIEKKICFFISSRNNYLMLEKEILKNFNLDSFLVINVDDGSNENEINYGKSICDKNNIIFIKNKSFGLQYALKSCVDYLDEKNYSQTHILHITHDNYPISTDFYDSISSIIDKKINFGLLGFNCFDYRLCRKDLINLRNKKKAIGLLGRAVLTNHDNFKLRKWYTSSNSSHFNLKALIAVESPADTCFLISIENFKKFIKVTNKIRLHNWADDISLQFLKNNIFNYCAPFINLFNANEIKQKYNIPIWSTRDQKKKHHSGIENGLRYWKEKWGWERNNYPTLEIINKRFKGTLVEKFYLHNPDKGPIKYVKD